MRIKFQRHLVSFRSNRLALGVMSSPPDFALDNVSASEYFVDYDFKPFPSTCFDISCEIWVPSLGRNDFKASVYRASTTSRVSLNLINFEIKDGAKR